MHKDRDRAAISLRVGTGWLRIVSRPKTSRNRWSREETGLLGSGKSAEGRTDERNEVHGPESVKERRPPAGLRQQSHRPAE
jgi:hypothetical protein